MVKKLSLLTIATFFASFILLPALAYAGADAPPPEPPSDVPPPPPKEKIDEEQIFGTPVAILPNMVLSGAFFHYPSQSQSDFVMRINRYGLVSGCAHLQYGKAPKGTHRKKREGKTEVEYLGNVMKVSLDIPEIALNDGEPRYTNYDCETSYLIDYVDIPLNRDDLIKKNVEKISLNTHDMDYRPNTVDINEDRLILKTNISEDAPERWVTLWFFPENTIKVYAPGAKSDMNVIQELRDFGLAHGLIPMDEVLEGYSLPHYANDYVYFTDPKDIFLRDLNNENNSALVGEIAVPKTYYGPEGSKEIAKPMPVYVSRVIEQKVWK